jgi:hypothetical protein
MGGQELNYLVVKIEDSFYLVEESLKHGPHAVARLSTLEREGEVFPVSYWHGRVWRDDKRYQSTSEDIYVKFSGNTPRAYGSNSGSELQVTDNGVSEILDRGYLVVDL